MKHKKDCNCSFCLGNFNFKKRHKAWNKGLTKETDERVRKYAEKLRGMKLDKKQRENLSRIKKKLFKEGRLKSWNIGLTKENNNILKENGKKISKVKKGKPLNHLKKYQFTSEMIKKRNLENNPLKRKDLEEKEKEIVRLYINENLSCLQLAEKFDCSTSPIFRILKENEIKIRKISGKTYEEFYGEEKAKKIKSKKGMPLEKNPNWQGGKSFEPYTKEFNNKFKRLIKKRDNYECLKCRMHQEKLNYPLVIHHIDYNKLLSIPQNCITLCNKCNSEVNFNRKHWIKFFQSLLAERYDYQYSEDKIILNLGNLGENEK